MTKKRTLLPSIQMLLQEAYATFTENISLFMSIAVLGVVINLFSEQQFLSGLGMRVSDGTVGLLRFVGFIGQFLMYLLTTYAIVRLKKVRSLADAFQGALPYAVPYLYVFILVTMIIIIGFIMLIIPGIIAIVWFGSAGYIFFEEKKTGWAALKRSREYVVGRWWPVATRVLGQLAIILGITIVANILFARLFGTRASLYSVLIMTFIGQVLYVYTSIYTYRLYTYLRKTHTN